MANVSVIIPTYNYGHFITEAIRSIVNQDYVLGEIEIIVVDDGSTDDTKNVLESFVNDGTIRYYYQANKGKANATSFAVQESNGKYIFNLDADDYFFPNKISEVVAIFEGDDSIVHVGAPAQFLNQNTQAFGVEIIPIRLANKALDGMWVLRHFYRNNILYGGGSTYCAKASILKGITIPSEVDMFIDEFLILAILPFGKSFFVEHPLSIWRIHSSNYSGINSTKEKEINKSRRLVESSVAILNYLKERSFDQEIIKIYQLQDETRKMFLKETAETKSMSDIFNYAKKVFIDIRPEYSLMKKYYVIKRFIPQSLYSFLKVFKTKTI
jgi:glycosyltransferase involved in cell wall biosynthesis